MNTLPTITSYGQYSSGNYGVNSLEVRFPNGFALMYSYNTIVAFNGRHGLRVIQNQWSTTTGKHLNWIDGGDKDARIAPAQFHVLLTAELEHYGLIPTLCECGDPINGTIQVHHHNEGEHVLSHEHIHDWTTPKEGETDEETGRAEKIFWCSKCDATLDSDGGIIK